MRLIPPGVQADELSGLGERRERPDTLGARLSGYSGHGIRIAQKMQRTQETLSMQLTHGFGDGRLPPMIREQMNLDLDVEVVSILRSRAAEANVSEGEIVDRAIRAYDLRSLVARIRGRSRLDEGAASALVREELDAVRAQGDAV